MAEYTVGIRMRADFSDLVGAAERGRRSQDDLKGAFGETKKSTAEAAEEAKKYIAALKEQADTFGMAKSQVAAYKVAQLELTQAQRELAAQTVLGIKAQEQQAEAQKKNEEQIKLVGKATAAATAAAMSYAVATAVAVKGIIDQYDSLQKLSQSLAVSTEFMSAFRYQGSLAGVSNEQLNLSVRNLARNMEEARNGVGDGGKLFRALGADIDVAVRSGVSIEQLMPMIADAFQRLPDGPTKTSLAIQLLGRGMERMIPLFAGGAAGMRDMTEEARAFGMVVESQAARQAEQFNDNLTRLNAAFTANKRLLANEYLPTLVDLTEKIVAATKATGGLMSGLAAVALAKTGNGGQDIEARIREIDATIAKNEKLIAQPRGWLQVADLGGWALDAENRKLANERAYLLTQRPQAKGPGTSMAEWMEPGGYGNDGEARVRAALARPGKAGGAERSDYESLSREATKSFADLSGWYTEAEKMTAAEKRLIELDALWEAGKVRLTAAQFEEVRAQFALNAEISRGISETERQTKAEEAATKAYLAGVEQQWKAVQALEDHNKKLADHNAEIGLTTDQVAQLKVARAEEALAISRQHLALVGMHDASEAELEIAQRRVAAAEQLVQLTRDGAARSAAAEQAKTAADEWKRTSDSIQRSLTDALMRGFDKGKTFAENFRDSLVNMFKTLVLEPIIRPIAQSAAGAITSSVMGGAARGGMNMMGGGGFPSPASFMNFGQTAADFGNFFGNVGQLTEMGEVFGIGDAIGGFAAANPWLIGGALVGGALLGDLFGGGGGPKASDVGLWSDGMGGLAYTQNNVTDTGAGEAYGGQFRERYAKLSPEARALVTAGSWSAGGPATSQSLIQQHIEPMLARAEAFDREKAAEEERNREEERRSILEQMRATLELADAVREFKARIEDLNLSDLSPLTARERLDYARGQYSSLLDAARGGDREALGNLAGGAQSYLKEARDFYASSPAYSAIFSGVQADAGGLVSALDDTLATRLADQAESMAKLVSNTEGLDVRIGEVVAAAIANQSRETVKALADVALAIERAMATRSEATVIF